MTCCCMLHSALAHGGSAWLERLAAPFRRSGGAAAGGRAADVHAHFFPEAYLRSLAEQGSSPSFPVEMRPGKPPTVARGNTRLELDASYWDLDRRIRRMDAQGVTLHALSLTAPMVHWAPPARGAQLARMVNDAMVEAHAAYPERFVGCAALPVQDPALALAELRRLEGQKAIRGVYLPTNAEPRELSDPAFFPLYERCQTLGLPLLLHPVAVFGQERLKAYYLGNLLGNPFDTTIAAANLIFGGVLDRFPRLDVVLPHAGGALPYLWGRLQHGQGVRPEAKDRARLPVRDYLRRFHYDIIGHAPELLRVLLDLVGADRILLGSDFCFDMGYEQPRAVVAALGLSRSEQERVLWGNAARLLKL